MSETIIPLIRSNWNRRKFRKGERIKSVIDLVMRLGQGQWLYLHDTPKHPQILQNMSLTTLIGFCERGYVHEAILNEDRKEGAA